MTLVPLIFYCIRWFIRHKAVWLWFALVIACTGIMIGMVNHIPAGHLKVIFDFSFLPYQLFCFIFALWYVIPFVHEHTSQGRCIFFLMQGISRPQFLWAFMVSVLFWLIIAGSGYYAVTRLCIGYLTGLYPWEHYQAYIMIEIEGFFTCALALLYALIAHGAVASFALMGTVIIFYNTAALQSTLAFSKVLRFLVALLPDLSLIDIKSAIIYELFYDPFILLLHGCYLIFWVGVIFFLSCLVFVSKSL